ncbi:hypothetical protein Zmor_005922 [Zophobas morio]|uniref:THAP9-like helix-turn-helix domain-containing protein n=1 Tax=Zophobas morio TaxID=2755281 RepID=A0AA38IYL6_9CUCU|nr:hypothetical protein Zmor_005922 [Zophobas morio]
MAEIHDYEHKRQLEIVFDQVSQLTLKKRRYSPATILFSFIMFSYSPSAYKFLRNYLLLPHKRYLQMLSSSFNISPDNESNKTKYYLTHVTKDLSERERYVNLLVNEIYVNSKLDFKGGNIVDNANNNLSQLAKTIQTFMISSTFGHFKEVVHLVPVSSMSMRPASVSVPTRCCQFVQHGLLVKEAVVQGILSVNTRVSM